MQEEFEGQSAGTSPNWRAWASIRWWPSSVEKATNHITQAMANPEIIVELGRRFKEYRLTYRLTQKEAAEKAGVSLITLRQFENGKAYNINMGNFLALLRVVDCLEQMDDLMPEIPVSAYTMERIMNKKPKRIRHGK